MDDIGCDLAAGGGVSEGVVGVQAARVVVAPGALGGVARATAFGVLGQGALGRVAPGGAVSGGDVGPVFAVGPEELGPEIEGQWEGN